jgi:hypothetical protein
MDFGPEKTGSEPWDLRAGRQRSPREPQPTLSGCLMAPHTCGKDPPICHDASALRDVALGHELTVSVRRVTHW